MKRNYLYIVMLMILAVVVTNNVIDTVNSIRYATLVNWSFYTAIYSALTIYFAGVSKKNKAKSLQI